MVFEKIPDQSVDLVITSPPYLNSRDYTDTYMVELKALGYMEDLNEIKGCVKKLYVRMCKLGGGNLKHWRLRNCNKQFLV